MNTGRDTRAGSIILAASYGLDSKIHYPRSFERQCERDMAPKAQCFKVGNGGANPVMPASRLFGPLLAKSSKVKSRQ